MTFRLLAPAVDDLYALEDWVAEHFGADVAASTHDRLVADFGLLAQFQHLGRRRPDVTPDPLRFFRSGHYYIVYRPGTPLLIHRILHTSMDLVQRLKG